MITVSITDQIIEDGIEIKNAVLRSVADTDNRRTEFSDRAELLGYVLGESVMAMQWPRESLVLANIVERAMQRGGGDFSARLTELENNLAAAASEIIDHWRNTDKRGS